MTNKNYPVRPTSSQKAAPVKKKDIHESLQDANQSAEKLHEQMTELNTKFATIQESGVTTRLDARSVELINTALAHMKATPKEVEKVLDSKMDKVIKQMDEKISEIKMLCIAITLFLNGLLAMVVFAWLS
ncbi:MAG: hypothetical protein J5548_11445 [Prevotella sp.]|nr:hypothetical protein [Prevotella sp.]